jgi:hypothetical protein
MFWNVRSITSARGAVKNWPRQSRNPLSAIGCGRRRGEVHAAGYREHDILLVTEDGNQNLTRFPYGPAHNVVPA